MDINDFENSLALIRDLMEDDDKRGELERRIRSGYCRITWKSVAETIIQACTSAATVEWRLPYPHASIPYTKEITFARLDRNIDEIGELLLSRIVSQRQGHYLDQPLDEQGFILGEEIRSDGVWASPENWGTWVYFPGGEIALALEPDSSGVFYVFLRLRVSDLLVDRPICIFVNSNVAWEGVIGSAGRDIMVRIRREVLESYGWRLRLRANVDNLSEDLRNQTRMPDNGVPCIGFERLIVVPGNDVTTRLDIVCMLLL
jgi:hypothetical protein